MERMFRILLGFKIARQVNDFSFVTYDEAALEVHYSRRIVVPDSVACLTDFLPRVRRPRIRPLPPPIHIDRFANRANGRISQLAAGLIWIVNMFSNETVPSRRTNRSVL
jgi:hypothetical protein